METTPTAVELVSIAPDVIDLLKFGTSMTLLLWSITMILVGAAALTIIFRGR
jgi:hypothetical protein